ncbi:MAG: ABC transporter permease [Anaerolineae bacterium]|nr:ABC transporter permease [Anaerolineae bacterium]
MNIFETIRTALESLASNKLRTILTMLGVIIGVASVVSLLSIGAGVSSGITSRVSSLGSNLLTISTDGRNTAARLTNNDVAALSDPLSVPGAERVVPEVRGNSRAAAGIYQRSTASPATPMYSSFAASPLSDGAVFTQQEIDLRARRDHGRHGGGCAISGRWRGWANGAD